MTMQLIDTFLLQCWENCELLQSNFQVWGAMCEEKEICVSILYIINHSGDFEMGVN